MARYWAYLNNEVVGPFGVEQLIRLRGFSRTTMVCVDDASGAPRNWISPAEIPELAPIFKAVDEHQAMGSAPGPVKPSPKPPGSHVVPKAPPHPIPIKGRPSRGPEPWLWASLVLFVIAGSGAAWMASVRRGARARELSDVKALVENARLPESSRYGSLSDYVREKQIRPRWEFEKSAEGLHHAILSWYLQTDPSKAGALTVYAFEVNLQAQTVRGLNTAATRLLNEGFPRPVVPKAPPPKYSPTALFLKTLEEVNDAIQNRDFLTLWRSFSRRKRTEMAKAGISQDGFIRLQSLTLRPDSGFRQSVLKTKSESPTEQLVLLKQSQTNRPDVFVKQFWVFEEGQWKLDDEDKRTAPSSDSPSRRPVVSSSTAPPSPAAMPGMGH